MPSSTSVHAPARSRPPSWTIQAANSWPRASSRSAARRRIDPRSATGVAAQAASPDVATSTACRAPAPSANSAKPTGSPSGCDGLRSASVSAGSTSAPPARSGKRSPQRARVDSSARLERLAEVGSEPPRLGRPGELARRRGRRRRSRIERWWRPQQVLGRRAGTPRPGGRRPARSSPARAARGTPCPAAVRPMARSRAPPNRVRRVRGWCPRPYGTASGVRRPAPAGARPPRAPRPARACARCDCRPPRAVPGVLRRAARAPARTPRPSRACG